jgi:putative glycosyltransferase (TIGR04372 family)
MKRAFQIPLKLPLFIIAIPTVLAIRLIRPWLLVRWGYLISQRIGHFAANTELYLCEREAGMNVPKQHHVDIFYMRGQICNQQLANMWKRVLLIWPAWILAPISRVNQLIPGGSIHKIGDNAQGDRDVHNLLDKQEQHLFFTEEEEIQGKATLIQMGITFQDKFVCLIVRDSLYISKEYAGSSWDSGYHSYRDTDIDNYQLAAETLAKLGYFVFRMGYHVKKPFRSNHPKVIDYATNGMRTDFMDIYLGANCAFCISVGTGFDAVPVIFRRSIIYVNMVPLGCLCTYIKQAISITKHHYLVQESRELTLAEIFAYGVGFSMGTSDYTSKGVELIENTPEEILDVVVEMADRMNGTWQTRDEDEAMQKRFWAIFPTDAVEVTNGQPLHGEIRARFGAKFLRNNREWLK